jgi:AraC-like DNA-binding protein
MEGTGRRARTVPVSTGTVRVHTIDVHGCKVMDARFPADLRIPAHTHDGGCVTVVVEGEFSERIMGRDHACGRASVLAKPPLEPHDDAFGRFGSRQLILEIAEGMVSELRDDAPSWEGIVHTRAAEAEGLARGVLRELATADAVSHLAIEGLTLELFACVWRLQRGRLQRCPPPWLRRVRECLSDEFQLSRTLREVAVDAGVHPAHLAREFRTHYGESIGQFVRRLRVEWAKAQLLGADDSLAAVAVRAGFSDQAHFTRWFKRQTGLTPHRYRSLRSGRAG